MIIIESNKKKAMDLPVATCSKPRLVLCNALHHDEQYLSAHLNHYNLVLSSDLDLCLFSDLTNIDFLETRSLIAGIKGLD